MHKKIMSSLLLCSLSFSTWAQDPSIILDKDIPAMDVKTLIPNKCEKINSHAFNYLRDSDYLERRLKMIKMSIDINSEMDDLFKDLRDDAAFTANTSKVIFGLSLAMLFGGTAEIGATAATTGVVSQAVLRANAMVGKVISVETGAAGVYFMASGQIATLAAMAYMVMIEPMYGVRKSDLAAVKSKKEAQRAFALVNEDFKNAQAHLDKLRGEVDLNYSRLANGPSFGSKSRKATEELYSISVAKSLLFATEYAYLESLQDKVDKCK